MAEQYVNNAVNTLSGSITDTDGFVTLFDSSAFPIIGDFRLRIDDELMLVTAVAGGVFTVTRGIEGTTAAAHNSGASAYVPLTRGSLLALSSSAPTGTGFIHVTGGTEDPAARAIDISTADVTGILPQTSTGALTGDVTKVSGSNATTIAANVVDDTKLAQMANKTYLGRHSAGIGNVEAVTVTNVTADLDAMVGDSGAGGTKGLVPAPAAGDNAGGKFLSAAGTWQAPAASATFTGLAPFRYRLIMWEADYNGSGSSATTFGYGRGWTASIGTQTFGTNSGGVYFQSTSGAVSGNLAGLCSGSPTFDMVQGQWTPDGYFVFQTGPSITSIRIWIGFGATELGNLTADPAGTQYCAAFRYDTGLDTVNLWSTVTYDGAKQVTLGVAAIAANTKYRMRIQAGTAAVNFYIDDVLVQTHSTHTVPAVAGMAAFIRIATLSAATRAILSQRVIIQMDA